MPSFSITRSNIPRNHAKRLSLPLVLLWTLTTHPAETSGATFNAPPGSHIDPTLVATEAIPSWNTTDRLVLTPYFYWYDVWSQGHLLNPDETDALTTHPITLTGFSYKSTQWHKTQLRDMEAAGIDVVLPVYWGDPSQLREIGPSHWSYAGIPPLVAARSALVAEGHAPPRIGMFYDTTTLQRNAWNEHVDLTTSRGQAWYYESIRDYFSLIHREHWALIDDRPIVFTWVSSWAKAYDQNHVENAKARFSADFGGPPFYLVKEQSWTIEADDVYAWGGAFGLRPLSVASIGPGYDHSNVPGRDPFVIDREGGAFFERNWIRLLRSGIDRVMIETWNEYHEGSDISHSREYGRQYIELNRTYSDQFKERFVPPPVPGPFSDQPTVVADFARDSDPKGIEWVEWSDGKSRLEVRDRIPCHTFEAAPDAVSYLYFRVHDSFRWLGTQDLRLTVTATAEGNTRFDLQFDGSDSAAPFNGAYTDARLTAKSRIASNAYAYEFDLVDARFLNSQNGGADLRLRRLQGDLCIHSLELTKYTKEVPPSSTPSLSIASVEPDRILLRVQGRSGTRYVVEESRDLVQWTPRASVFIPIEHSSGDLPVVPQHPARYFRIRQD